jgi:hypothetical protein
LYHFISLLFPLKNYQKNRAGNDMTCHHRRWGAFYRNTKGSQINSLLVWLVADAWCWFVLREKYCWLVADG